MTLQKFQKLYNETHDICQDLHKKSNYIAIMRFVLGMGVIAGLLVGYFQNLHILYGISLLCLIIFLVTIRYHDSIKQDLLEKQSLANVYQDHIKRMTNQWTTFSETGQAYLNDNPKAIDLDIVGHHSLFQMINLAFTQKGQKKLADILIEDGIQQEELEKHQETVLEMSQHEAFVLQLEAYGKMTQAHKETVIQNFMTHFNIHSYEKISPFVFIVSFITIVSLFCLCFSIGLPYTLASFEIGAVAQLCFAFLNLKKHQELFEPVAFLNKSVQSYLRIFQLIEDERFESQLFKALQLEICVKGKAVKGIQELSRLSQRIGYRQNIIAILVLNALGLYDFWLRNQYIGWLEKYHQDLERWFDGLGQIEVCASLSVLKIDDFDVVMPKVQKEKLLSFKNLRHPLIVKEKVVGNSFVMKDSVCVITGSNMSGKTTFMRTIGLNLVLAYAGGFVLADQMTCCHMHIMTSMRVKDNVEEGVSTFYGELLRIKEMICYAKEEKPMLCLIDEIFKGTNSLDRIAGAKATIQKLSLPYSMTFLTTHDFELCRSQNVECLNYHFDEFYENNHICFDYLIKEGQSQSTNGQFLLKQLGIME